MPAAPSPVPPAPLRPGRASPLLVLFLAARMLRESRLTLALLVIATASGVAFQIPNIANLAGYRAELLAQEIDAGMGHVRVRPQEGDRFPDATDLLDLAARLPGVDEAVPLLSLPGSLRHKSKVIVIPIAAIDPATRHRPYQLDDGEDLASDDEAGIVLGTRLASQLGVGIGDTVELQLLLATRPRLVLDDGGVGLYDMKVRGLVGGNTIDRAFINHRFMADELGEDNPATLVLVYARDSTIGAARRIAAAIDQAMPLASAKSWFDDSRLIRSTVGAIDAVKAIASVMSLLAVAVPVLALLYIDALHRGRQVALLCATGFTSRDVFVVFLAKAVLIGLAGAGIGVAVGYGMLVYFDAHPIYEYDKFVIRPVINAQLLFWPALQVFLTTLVAGSYPALRAARTNPSPMLRRIE